MPTAALDLGTTRIKACLIDEAGQMQALVEREAPPLLMKGLSARGDAASYLDLALELLEELAGLVPERGQDPRVPIPLGLSCQRSSFLLWQSSDGHPVTDLISWQDRSPESWCRERMCQEHADWNQELHVSTGLVLSPHYLAPKLKLLLEREPSLQEGLRRGELLWGTLDCYLLWRLSGQWWTDLTMAARTQLVELGARDWSPRLLERFGLQGLPLPKITDSVGLGLRLGGDSGFWILRASLSDQAAAARALLTGPGQVLVNLGTGGFVLKPLESDQDSLPEGYLLGPLLAAPGGVTLAAEGTINGLASALAPFQELGDPLERWSDELRHGAEGLFALPDATGLGAPFWRAELGVTFSDPEASEEARQLALLEGILFRLWGILQDFGAERISEIRLAGGLSNLPFLAQGLRSLSGIETSRPDLAEASLLGAAALARHELGKPAEGDARIQSESDCETDAESETEAEPQKRGESPGREAIWPDPRLAYLKEKTPRWRAWLLEQLAR